MSESTTAAALDEAPAPLTGLLPVLACPVCGQSTLETPTGGDLHCAACRTRFPVFTSGHALIPWLFRDPDYALAEWRARYRGFVELNRQQCAHLRQALDTAAISRLTRERISHVLTARGDHAEQIKELVMPFTITDGGDAMPAGLAADKLPANQGLLSYYANIFRDWSWNNGEQQALWEAFGEVLDSAIPNERILTLGSGAGRLSYELHLRANPSLSVLLDINPLLQSVTSRIATGVPVSLYEFPIAPRDGASGAVLQECRTAEAIHQNFHLVSANALAAPFAHGSFDTVVTPWLIDVIPEDVRVFVKRINALLEPGGVWLNTGTLAFFHSNAARCFSEAELFEVVAANGFEIQQVFHSNVPYLQSPWSGHGRVEQVLSFRAQKVGPAEEPPVVDLLPESLARTDISLPENEALALLGTNRLFQAQVLGSVDGKRSIEDISTMLAIRYSLPLEEVIRAVQQLLAQNYEETLVSDDWLRSSS